MPHFLRIHYLCDYCCYEWSLFSLDRGGFQGLNPMPHFLRIHYLCDYCFYEWSLSSLDRGGFQGLNRKRDEDGFKIISYQSWAILWMGWEIPFPSIYLQLISLLFHLLKSNHPNNFDEDALSASN